METYVKKETQEKADRPLPEIFLTPLPKKISGNYFSATIFQTYLQCPIKYFLKYSIGLPEGSLSNRRILSEKKNLNQADFEFSNIDKVEYRVKQDFSSEIEYPKSDPEVFLEFDSPYILPGKIKGKILHKIMEEIDSINRQPHALDEIIEKTFKNYNLNLELGDNTFILELKNQIKLFLNSKSWKIIKQYDKFYCEYELNAVFADDFLIGTMDRICLNDDILIVDYKTEKINKNQLKSARDFYHNQMLFYAHLARQYFPGKAVKSILVFLDFPDEIEEIKFTAENFLSFNNVLNDTINQIKDIEMNRRQIMKNKSHCRFCEFYKNNQCIFKG
jgi:ATP-dependent exoDNAse (exonuclease V) beta subunit